MSGRPIKCVVVGDGTGKVNTLKGKTAFKMKVKLGDFNFSRKDVYAHKPDDG